MIFFEDFFLFDDFLYNNCELVYVIKTNDYFLQIILETQNNFVNNDFFVTDKKINFLQCSRFFEYKNTSCTSNFFKFFYFIKPVNNVFYTNIFYFNYFFYLGFYY